MAWGSRVLGLCFYGFGLMFLGFWAFSGIGLRALRIFEFRASGFMSGSRALGFQGFGVSGFRVAVMPVLQRLLYENPQLLPIRFPQRTLDKSSR